MKLQYLAAPVSACSSSVVPASLGSGPSYSNNGGLETPTPSPTSTPQHPFRTPIMETTFPPFQWSSNANPGNQIVGIAKPEQCIESSGLSTVLHRGWDNAFQPEG